MQKITLVSEILNDKYTEYIYNAYDIQNREKTIVEVPLNLGECKRKEWQIGIILGGSGAGKSTILSRIGGVIPPTYDFTKAIISNFPTLSEEEVCRLFTSVGLSSVPTWLRKPQELSNGERARLDLAWSLNNSKDGEVILFDEFTSVVDRDVAKSISYCLQKYIRKNNKKIILASCHYDIIPFLTPDWIYNLNKQIEGVVEVEWQIYSDDKEYEEYKQVDDIIILSEKKEIE